MTLFSKVQEIRPLLPVVIITGHGTMDAAVQALRAGAADFLAKPIKLLELDAVLEKCINLADLRKEKVHLHETIRAIQHVHDVNTGGRKFVGESEATQQIRAQIQTAVEGMCDAILVTGATGTGKEVVAREIHRLAEPEDSPFIAVSCPALPATLVESELFGHVKGAFTGASGDKTGYFELADGGTLFLDEIADLSPESQATLLRVLETRTLRRVGGAEEKSVRVRVIAATNADLEKRVREGQFRRDLFFRLNVFSISLIPLRQRPEDVRPLADHFLSVFASRRGMNCPGFSSKAYQLLMEYDFPGNARELRNMVERAVILSRGDAIIPQHLSIAENVPRVDLDRASVHDKEDPERARILEALEATKWNRKKAAERLDMPYSTLRYKIKSLGIE